MNKQKQTVLGKSKLNLVVIVLLATTTVANVWGLGRNKNENRQPVFRNNQRGTVEECRQLADRTITPLDKTKASNSKATAEELAFIIEEEKLAHDIYHVLGEKWNIRTFDNIKQSELTHQSLVWAVMKSRGLADPSKAEIGKFSDPDLQKLYDELLAKGLQSPGEAIKVGIAVEEVDIADLKRVIANLDPKDTDVKAVMENLLRGSENHLSAFQRQLPRWENTDGSSRGQGRGRRGR